jgi:tetratricopeptide (TPR) repeat protein
MKLYSPQVHTLRALIINNAGTRGMFPANDIIREQDVLNSLNLSPAEIDVLDAAMSVSKGIKASGNSELLYLASSPREMLSRQRLGLATSRIRFDLERPKFSYEQTVTASRIPAVDVRFTGTARGLLGLEVQGGDTYSSRLGFEQSQPFVYSQRLYLLPGEYTLFLDVDGFRTGYSLRVDKVDTLQKQAVNVADGDDWTAIGKQYLKTGDAARAGACFAKALKLRRSPEALLGAARVAFARQQLDAARDLLWEALSLRPDHFEALVTLAGVTAEFQDYPLARQMYERAVAIRDHPALRQALQQLPR